MAFPHERCRQAEIMDQSDLQPNRHRHALSALARINFLSNTAGSYFPHLVQLQQQRQLERLRILDVACGGGDVALRLWRRALRQGLDWRLAGCDLSPVAIEVARDRARAQQAEVHFFTHDVLARPLETHYDAVLCSLFLHHLDNAQAVALLAALKETGAQLILVNDLQRSRLGLMLAQVVSRLLTTSSVVHVDGPLSVRAAFTPLEALALAEVAGLHGACVRRCWPCRWLLSWRRP